MEVSVGYPGETKFEVAARGHRVICDQPIDNGGADEGMSPPEFLLASLATCAGYYAAQYLKTRRVPAEDLKVRVTGQNAAQPARLALFEIEVTAIGLDERPHRRPEIKSGADLAARIQFLTLGTQFSIHTFRRIDE